MLYGTEEDVKRAEGKIISWRRWFHANPELRDNTVMTEARISEALKDMGISDVLTGVGGRGVVATIRGGLPGKCLAIRADCDGLPIREETGLPFASVNGSMHACGHDAHMAMALGAAEVLRKHRDEIKGSVKLVFQPYEEGGRGAQRMIADGALRSPDADAIIALHIGNIMGMGYDSGDVVVSPKHTSACIYGFKATFHGKGTHVCTPHLGIDPVFMACSAVVEIQSLLSREKDPLEAAVIGVCMIHGGSRNNSIPDECSIEGSIRSFSREVHERYCRRFREICRSVAEGLRGTVDFETVTEVPSTKIDPDLYRRFLEVAGTVVPPDRLKIQEHAPLMGEDFAYFSDEVPALYFYVCSKPVEGECFPHHHPKFDIDEAQMIRGTALLSEFALHWQD